jgi:hypothetical protein
VRVLTSLLQKYLDLPWLALVNAASPWLTTAFVAGALQSRLATAAVVGRSSGPRVTHGWHRRQYPALALWLVPAFIAGVAGHAVLGLVL